MSPMQFDIVTAERLVSSEEVQVIVAPGIDGELAILPHHAPLLTVLKPGEIRVVKDGEESFIATSGGFMEVMANKVTILADTAEREDEIDLKRAEEALQQAEEGVSVAASDVELARALESTQRYRAMVKVARRQRRRGGNVNGPTTN